MRRTSTWLPAGFQRFGWIVALAVFGGMSFVTSEGRADETSTSAVLRRCGIYTPYDNSRPYANDGTSTRRYGIYNSPQRYVAQRTYYSDSLYRPWYWYPYTYAYYGYSQPWYRPFYYPYVPYGYFGRPYYGRWNVGVRWYPGVSYYYGGGLYGPYRGCYYW